MANVIGYLGNTPDDGILFRVSQDTVLTLSNMKWGGTARFATHQRHCGEAMIEFTGLEPDSFTFDMLVCADLGVEPMAVMKKLWKMNREGEAVALVIGGHCYGRYRWGVKKIDAKLDATDTVGDLYEIRVSVTLVAYARR